jgi:Protein of unknown function (DUF2505)
VKLTLTYDLACSPEAFWERYFNTDYTVRLHQEALGSSAIEVETVEGDLKTGLRRVLRYSQSPDMPGPVKKIFGQEVKTVEVSTFDPATATSSFTLTPSTMADKTKISGALTVVPNDGAKGQSLLTFILEAKVKIFGVGPVAERFIERQARDTQDKAVEFMRMELAAP